MRPSVKGTLLGVALSQVSGLVERGVIGEADVERALGADWRAVARSVQIAPSAWHPIEFYDRALTLMMNTAGGRDPEYLVELGRQAAADLAKQGIYKQLDRQAPENAGDAFVRSLVTLAKALYSFTTWELDEYHADEGWFSIRVTGAGEYPESLRFRNVGFLETMTTHATRRACRVTSERSPRDCIRFRVEWTQKR